MKIDENNKKILFRKPPEEFNFEAAAP